MDIKSATLYVAQGLRQYRQLWGIQKQIERANQELALINMATIQKQQALTVLMDLINRVTESQILQLMPQGAISVASIYFPVLPIIPKLNKKGKLFRFP